MRVPANANVGENIALAQPVLRMNEPWGSPNPRTAAIGELFVQENATVYLTNRDTPGSL
jgi:hypothetical protein